MESELITIWPEFRKWVPKIGNCKILGRLFFQGKSHTQITTVNMYLFIEILKEKYSHENCSEEETFNYMHGFDILEINPRKIFGVLRGDF